MLGFSTRRQGQPTPALLFRPSAVAVGGILVALVLVWVIAFTPLHSSPVFGRDTTLDFWWSHLVPKSYARHLLNSLPAFRAFNDLPDCGDVEGWEGAWYTIASSPDAEAQFLAMFARGGPATRLYAITGLAFLESPSFRPLLARLARDTVTVHFDDRRGNVDPRPGSTYILVVEERAVKQMPFGPPAHVSSLAALVTEQRVRLWAALLASIGSRSCAV